MENALVFCVKFFMWWTHSFIFVLNNFNCETHSGVLCYMFLCIGLFLVFCVRFFHRWNAIWYFVIYFLRVALAMVFFVKYFYMWNSLWYFVLSFIPCGTCSGILCSIFPPLECCLIFCHIYLRLVNVLCYFLLMCYILSMCWRAPV